MDVPNDIPVRKVTADIIECLGSVLKVPLDVSEFCIVSNRMDKILMPDETLEEAGVWNGDYITLMKVEM